MIYLRNLIGLIFCLILIQGFANEAKAKAAKKKKIVHIELKPETKKSKRSQVKIEEAKVVSYDSRPIEVELEPLKPEQKKKLKKASKKKIRSRKIASANEGVGEINRTGMPMPDKVVLPEVTQLGKQEIQAFLKDLSSDEDRDLVNEIDGSF